MLQSAAGSSQSADHPPFPKLSKTQISKDLVPEINQWSLTNGLVMSKSGTESVVAPTTVYPTPIARSTFEQAKGLQKSYNKLYASVSNSEWLKDEMKLMAEADPEFTGKLVNINNTIESKQKMKLGIFRSDYLIEKKSKDIKQVEFNTVSVSFGGLSTKVGELHSFMNAMGKYQEGKSFYNPGELLVSESSVFLSRGIAGALSLYQVEDQQQKENKIVLFVVERGEKNLHDQKLVEYNLLRLYGIQSVRATFDEITSQFEIKGADKRLVYKKTGVEVGVVYYRTGYTVSDYHSEKDWDVRKLLEESYAIKAPNVSTQLAGSKKIQQELTKDEILSKFVDDQGAKDELVKTFVKIYPLDDTPLGKEGKKLALESPAKYVLKPQREGGNNNIYKEDIPKFLKSIDEKEWSAYILMELIDTKATTENFILRENELSKEPIISELGIFGCVLYDAEGIHLNEFSGSLLRSKLISSNEGGVVAGHACIDSIYLTN